MKAQAMLPLTRSIPTERLYECFVLAMEAREPGNTFLVSGVELLSAWKVLRERMEAESGGAYDKSRMLTANAANACPKCFGTGMERMPNGSVRKGCQHEGWTPEFEDELERNEEAQRDEVKKQADFMKEALSRVGSPKPVESPSASKPSTGVWVRCTKCPRKLNVLYFDEPGRTCGDLLNRGVHDGDLKFCDGILEVL